MSATLGNRNLVLSDVVLEMIQTEATRAHLKHGSSSMMSTSISHDRRLAILAEEVGEVARELNDAVLGDDGVRTVDVAKLASELAQVAAMAASWLEVLLEQEK